MALSLKKRDLTKYDIIVAIDISGSTSHNDTPSGKSRLDDSKKLTSVLIAEMEQIDDDGVTVHFFDDRHEVYENTTLATIQDILARARPRGTTDTAGVLNRHITEYFDKRFGKAGKKGGLFSKGIPAIPADPNTKPIIIVVITDGQPNSTGAVVTEIVNATKRLTAEGLDRNALGISFIQTGNDAGATRFLEMLDDDLGSKGATMDIVNCVKFADVAGMSAEEILERALDD